MTKTQAFLQKINMRPQQTDIDQTAEDIMLEMHRGLMGEQSSLRMLPTYLNCQGSAPENAAVIAIDAGGTNLRVGLVNFVGSRPVMKYFSKTPVPGSQGRISSDEFFDTIAERILPLTAHSQSVGFCFSYPAEVLPNHDGKILQLNKELSVSGAEGKMLGEELIKKLRLKGVTAPIKFTLLNDTTANLMGGIAVEDLSHCDGFAGLILGTGFNTCYLEQGKNIKKLSNAPDMIINCESGNFSKALCGIADQQLDAQSYIPQDHLLEKKLGGAYIGGLISLIARLAAQGALLSPAFKDSVPFTAVEIDDFLRGENNRISQMCTESEREVLTEITDAVYTRAARLVCANIQALCLHCNGGKSAAHPFCIVAEGSTFYNSLLFRPKLEALLREHLEFKHRLHVICLHAENATMTGTALAALLN